MLALIRKVNNSIICLFDKCFDIVKKIRHKRYFLPLVFLGMFLIIFLCFFLFTYTHPIYEGNLFHEGNVWKDGEAIRKDYNAFLNTFDTTNILIFGIVLICIIAIIFIYLLINKRISFLLGLVTIFSIAFIIRLIYMGYCDAIFRNQHDVWSDYNVGHLSITFSLFYTGKVPELFKDFNMSYQLYQFKTSHAIFAGWMQIMKLFVGNNDYVLYQSLKIISTAMSMGIVILTYYILKELGLTKRALIFGLLTTISFPTLVLLGANTNNDTCLIFFTYLSMYFAIKFYKKQSWFNIILLAISIGLTISTKLSGALIALPIGVMMIYLFFKSIKCANFKQLIIYYVVFIAICFPLAFSWAYLNHKIYGYPLTYVWQVTNNNLMVNENITFFDRYLFINFKTLFDHPFVILSGQRQDYNFFEFLLKTQLFGEWSLPNNLYDAAYLMLGLNFGFVIVLFFIAAYFIIKLLIKHEYNKLSFYLAPLVISFGASAIFGSDLDKVIGLSIIIVGVLLYVYWLSNKKRFYSPAFLAVISIYAIYVVSYTYFNMKEPFTCTMDFRYMIPMLLVISYFFGVYLDKFIKEYKKVTFNK